MTPARNLSVYRNNTVLNFRAALEASFPVVRRRVGEDYFRQLAHFYQERYPSRSGDLHWVGRDFAEFLDDHLRESEYAWLADLARLEWSREEASIVDAAPAIAPEALAKVPPDELANIVFKLQPSLSLHTYSFPIFSVCLANQVEDAPPVDQSVGPEAGMVRARNGSVEVRLLPPALFSYMSALAAGSSLGEAMTLAELDEPALVGAMGFLFSEGLVTSISVRSEDQMGGG